MPGPEVAVVFATHRRPSFLPELVAALEAQDLAVERFEVVAVDDASGDETPDVLARLAASTPLRLTTVSLEASAGPAAARAAGVARTRAPILAFTDDDCLPTASWLSALLRRFDDTDVVVVQGRTEARPGERDHQTPWDHTLWVTRPTPWFETCNIAYRRSAYEQVGGFDLADPVLNRGGGDHFGEDVDLGARVLAAGGRRDFAADAVVHHRVAERDWAGWLEAQRRLVDFPDLARRSAVVRAATLGGVFLNRSTATFDAAAAGALLAIAGRRAWPALLAVPWLRRRWADALRWSGGDRSAAAALLARFAAGDAVVLASLARGSARHRKLLL